MKITPSLWSAYPTIWLQCLVKIGCSIQFYSINWTIWLYARVSRLTLNSSTTVQSGRINYTQNEDHGVNFFRRKFVYICKEHPLQQYCQIFLSETEYWGTPFSVCTLLATAAREEAAAVGASEARDDAEASGSRVHPKNGVPKYLVSDKNIWQYCCKGCSLHIYKFSLKKSTPWSSFCVCLILPLWTVVEEFRVNLLTLALGKINPNGII
jgi:hypothetical protein